MDPSINLWWDASQSKPSGNRFEDRNGIEIPDVPDTPQSDWKTRREKKRSRSHGQQKHRNEFTGFRISLPMNFFFNEVVLSCCGVECIELSFM